MATTTAMQNLTFASPISDAISNPLCWLDSIAYARHVADIKSYRERFQNAECAERYAARFESGPRTRIDRREQQAVQSILSALPDCRTILDVPSGAGRLAAALTQRDRQLVEMDVAMEILRHAAQRAEKHRVLASFVQGDASRLPLISGAIDCIFCNRLL